MKHKIIYYPLILVLLLLSVFKSCKKILEPEVTILPITDITYTSAKCGGVVTNGGGDYLTNRGFCWSKIRNPKITDSKTQQGTIVGSFESQITGLTPGTTYYVRAYATNSLGTGYSNQETFITLTYEIPVLTTKAISGYTTTSVISGGNITSDGGSAITARGVCWSSTVNPTIANNKTNDGIGTGTFTSLITGLSPGISYYVRAYATNSIGTSYGDVMSFSTSETSTCVTLQASNISATGATLNGTVNPNQLSTTVTFEYGTTTNYGSIATASQSPVLGSTTINVSASITGLITGTIYHYRVKAVNSLGTTYGNDMPFTPVSSTTVVDVDGNIYNIVTIGTQVWMKENLKTTKYNDGTAIPLVTDNTAWCNLTTAGYCYYNNDATTYKNTYGALYNWYTINTGKLCPPGWHVPSDVEWTTLTTFLGGLTIAGGKLKEVGTTHWASPNTGATDETGFTALPGGNRSPIPNQEYYYIGVVGFWWSSTEYSDTMAWYWNMKFNYTSVGRGYPIKQCGFSVRCLRN